MSRKAKDKPLFALRVALRLLAVSLALGTSGCAANEAAGSSSTSWLECTRDEDCEGLSVVAECSPDSICVDEDGHPIPASYQLVEEAGRGGQPEEAGSTGPGQATPQEASDATQSTGASNQSAEDTGTAGQRCYPLAPWRREVSLGDPRAIAQSSEGTVYVVTELEGQPLVLQSEGDTLKPMHVSLGDEDGTDTIFYVDAPSPYELHLSQDNQLEFRLGKTIEPLSSLSVDDVSSLPILPLESAAKIVARLGANGDRSLWRDGQVVSPGEVLLVEPEWGGGESDARVFYAVDGVLIERRIESYSQAGGLTLDFWVDDTLARIGDFIDEEEANFELGGQFYALPARSTLPVHTSPLELVCSADTNSRFALSPEPTPTTAGECVEGAFLDVLFSVPGVSSDDSVTFDGEVQVAEIGNGPLPEGAEIDCGNDTGRECPESWIRFDNGGEDVWLLVGAKGFVAPVSVGETVSIIANVNSGPFYRLFQVELRVADQLRAWFYDDEVPFSVTPDGIQLWREDELCDSGTFGCMIDSAEYALFATDPDGNSVSTLPGQQSTVGPWLVSNFSYTVGAGDWMDGCFDSPGGDVQLAVWKTDVIDPITLNLSESPEGPGLWMGTGIDASAVPLEASEALPNDAEETSPHALHVSGTADAAGVDIYYHTAFPFESQFSKVTFYARTDNPVNQGQVLDVTLGGPSEWYWPAVAEQEPVAILSYPVGQEWQRFELFVADLGFSPSQLAPHSGPFGALHFLAQPNQPYDIWIDGVTLFPW